MIHFQNKLITSVFFMKLALSKVAYGARIIWEVISSCFGSGIWRNANAWKDGDLWKNN